MKIKCQRNTSDVMSEDTFYTFSNSDFEIKEVGEHLFVSGFVSSFEVDENNDLTSQEILVRKLNDPDNDMAKNLSYKHKWLKKDKDDFESKLGVMEGKAEIKTNPKTNEPGVWATYKLLKTSPYYNDALYDIKNRGVSGFSIEFKDAKRNLIKFGNTIANYLEDFFLGGVALVARPAVKSTHITGFFTKEIYLQEEGEEAKMEKKDAEVPKTQETTAPAEVTKDDLDKIKAETDALKAMVEKERTEVESLRQNTEKEKLKKELEQLQAERKVLVPQGEQQVPGTIPAEKDKIDAAKKDADDIVAIAKDKSQPVYNRILKVLDATYKE
jgi:hypothetical protein